MISEETMAKICPVPTLEEETEQIQRHLVDEGFVVNNFTKGSPFWFLTRLVAYMGIELKNLAVKIINGGYVRHAQGDWLEIKAADYSKTRKPAQKTKGYVTIYRENYDHSLQIKKGYMFKTLPDLDGREMKFFCCETAVLGAGEASGRVLVEAEEAGAAYNIPPGRITVPMIHMDGVSGVANEEGWLAEEGADQEDLEALRSRCLSAWEELAENTTDGKLISVASEVPGVVNVQIDSQHPRGQGTTDIIITSTAGEATEELCRKVYEKIKYMEGSYDDFLVRSALVVAQDFDITIWLAQNVSVDGADIQAEDIIRSMLGVGREDANALYLDNLRGEFWNQIPGYRKSEIADPLEDTVLPAGHILVCGNVHVLVKNLE